MKFITTILAFAMLTACVKLGNGSKNVKFLGCLRVDDGNNGDSTFFKVSYRNKGDEILKNANCDITIKDTSSTLFKSTLFSSSSNNIDAQPHSDFYFYIYSKDFTESNAVGKSKFLLTWTNKKGRQSLVRYVEQ